MTNAIEIRPKLEDFYNPPVDKCIGFISTSGRCTAFGWCQDSNSTLVALAVVGSSTSINALWAHVVAGKSITCMFGTDPDTTSSWDSTYAHTSGRGYKAKRKIIVTDDGVPTQFYSMIISESTLFGLPKMAVGEGDALGRAFMPHVPGFEQNLRLRVRQLVTIDVLPQWADYIFNEGEKRKLCGKLLHSDKPQYRIAKSFNVVYHSASQEAWEKLITDGLKSGQIRI